MKITAKHASLIALASVACALISNARAQQSSSAGPNFYSPGHEAQAAAIETARIEGQLSVVRSPALDKYFGQLLGNQQHIPLGFQKFAKQYESEADKAAPSILETLHLDSTAFAAAQAAVQQ